MRLLRQISPTKLLLEGDFRRKELEPHLKYTDKAADFELKRLTKSNFMKAKLGEENWTARIQELKELRDRSLLFGDEEEGFHTYSGLASTLANNLRAEYVNEVEYPESGLLPWSKPPDKSPRPYQQTIFERLLNAKHGAVSVATGLGKSFCCLMLTKELSLKTVIMAPSINIASQLYEEFSSAFGTSRVGRFYDGKKESKKLITVAVSDSLSEIQKNTEHWNNLVTTQVFIADESHMTPARTLAAVCFGLLADAPYRFFFSATQLRNDGKGLLLKAIIGDIVFEMSLRRGVEEGWLAQPMFRIIPYESDSTYFSSDVTRMQRVHLFDSVPATRIAGTLTNMFVELGRPTLVLVKEISQFTNLLPYLRHSVEFAHGTVNAEQRQKLPQKYWKSNNKKLVNDFNDGKFPVLVGTSSISIGTDIRAAGAVVYWRGGTSGIDVPQCVGRGTRRPEGKDNFYFADLDCTNIEDLHRHAEVRKDIYTQLYPDVEEIRL